MSSARFAVRPFPARAVPGLADRPGKEKQMTGRSTEQAGAPGVRSGTQLSSQGGTTMTGETISATTIINAPAEAIFAVLADPAKHAAIDGTGWVREPLDGQPLTAAGQKKKKSGPRLPPPATPIPIPPVCRRSSEQLAGSPRRTGHRVTGQQASESLPLAWPGRAAAYVVAGAARARRCPGSGRLAGPPAARTPPPTPPRPASPTRPGRRPPTSRSPSSTCSATKTSPTPCAPARPAYPSSSTFTPAPRTNPTSSPSTPPKKKHLSLTGGCRAASPDK